MRRLSPALLTLGMLGVVGVLVVLYVGKQLLAVDKQPPVDPVLTVPMALSDLEPGTRITEAHLGMGTAKQSSLTRDTAKTNRVLIGRIVMKPISQATPIRMTDLYAPGEGPAPDIEPGMRAVTIPMPSSSGISDGLIKPGQYVDVHFTPTSLPDEDESGGLTLTMFKGVKLLAVNGVSTGSASTSRGEVSISLELTPEQANIILLAEKRGTLNLTYTAEGKGTGVVGVSDENRATLYEILDLAPKPDPEPPFTTEIFRGSEYRSRAFRNGIRLRDDERYSSPDSGRGTRNPPATSTDSPNGDTGSGQARELPTT